MPTPYKAEVLFDNVFDHEGDHKVSFWSEADRKTLRAIAQVMVCSVLALLIGGGVAYNGYHTQTETVIFIGTSAANDEHPNLIITDHGTFELAGINLLIHGGKFDASANSMFREISEEVKPHTSISFDYYGWDFLWFDRHILYYDLNPAPVGQV